MRDGEREKQKKKKQNVNFTKFQMMFLLLLLMIYGGKALLLIFFLMAALSFWKSLIFLLGREEKSYLRTLLQGIVNESLFHHHLESLAALFFFCTSSMHSEQTFITSKENGRKLFTWNRVDWTIQRWVWVWWKWDNQQKANLSTAFVFGIDVSRCFWSLQGSLNVARLRHNGHVW